MAEIKEKKCGDTSLILLINQEARKLLLLLKTSFNQPKYPMHSIILVYPTITIKWPAGHSRRMLNLSEGRTTFS